MQTRWLGKFHRTSWKVGALLFVVISVAAVWFLVVRYQTNSGASRTSPPSSELSPALSQVCGDDLIKQANPYLKANDSYQLGVLSEKIEGMSGYAGDIDCNYIIFEASIRHLDTDKAQEALTRINSNASKGAYLSNNFSPSPSSLETLRQELEMAKESKTSIRPGVPYREK